MNDTYWNYSYTLMGKKETYKESFPGSDDGYTEIIPKTDPNAKGKYSSLANAIKGFLNEEIGQESKLSFRKDENGSVVLNYETYVNDWYMPANQSLMKNWKNGSREYLIHVKGIVRFFKHEYKEAAFEEFEEVKADIEKMLKKYK